MSRAGDVAGRWFDRQLGRTNRLDLSAWADRLLSGRTVSGMPALLSYGPHFPLVVYVGKGKRRRGGPLLVLNGDRWSGGWGTTNRHQEIVRQLADGSGLEQCLIPFSALTAAGIDISTIEVRDRRPDTTWEEERESAHLSDVPRWKQQESYRVPRAAMRLEDVPPNHRWHSWFDEDGRRYHYRPVDGLTRLVSECGTVTREPRDEGMTWREWAPQDSDGRYTWEETRHRDVSPDEDGLYRWTQSFHRLGDCLFSAETEHSRTVFDRTNEAGEHLTRREIVRRRAVFVSSFDTNEPAPLYFLAEVPRSAGARTVGQAIDSLAPRAVHAAIAQGRKVYRQGDVFAIETPLTDDEIRERTVTRARLTQWTRGARAKAGETGFVAPLTAAERRRWARAARRRYREIRAAQWSTCRPEGKLTLRTVGYPGTQRDVYRYFKDHAYSALEQARRETMPARMRAVDRETIRGAVAIYGTAHAATEVVTARGGATYCRGVLRQVPDLERGRDSIRDHIPVTLGDGQTWFLAVRNTVPARADGTPVGGPLR